MDPKYLLILDQDLLENYLPKIEWNKERGDQVGPEFTNCFSIRLNDIVLLEPIECEDKMGNKFYHQTGKKFSHLCLTMYIEFVKFTFNFKLNVKLTFFDYPGRSFKHDEYIWIPPRTTIKAAE